MSKLFGTDFITLAYLRRYPESARKRAWHGVLVHIETTSGVWCMSGKGYTHAGSPDAWVLPFGEALWQIISLGPEKNARLLRAFTGGASWESEAGQLVRPLNSAYPPPRTLADWHEGIGPVLWWCWCGGGYLSEAPYLGTPLDRGVPVEITTHAESGSRKAGTFFVGGWPGYHTHWTPLPAQPSAPSANRDQGA